MAKGYQGRRVFRRGPGWILLFVGLTALFATGAVVTYRDRGWSWVSVGLTFATVVLGLGSIIETIVLRIELTDEAMIVTELTGRRRYRITEIEGIAEAKGSPPMLLLANGRRVELPSVTNDLGNSVRAWLKRQRES